MISPQAQAVKDWLSAYREDEIRIDNQFERLRRLEARMKSVKAVEISDMPKAFGSSTDGLTEYVIKKESIISAINRLSKIHDKDRAAIEELVRALPKALEQNVIELRYLDGMDWQEVTASVCGADAVKFDSSMRRVYRAHESALEFMAKNWSVRKG